VTVNTTAECPRTDWEEEKIKKEEEVQERKRNGNILTLIRKIK
jgi:hypothetical protein